ncbi:hypothetical protein F4809DRAFT_607256 [Biscogniauxia mediterranea]|nr:hypothetical protein F4809DRAFT_607256 [Biscogniauxia mediterranea]
MSADHKQQQPRQSSHLPSSPSSSAPLMASQQQQQQQQPPHPPSSPPSPSSDEHSDEDGSYKLSAATPLRLLATLLSLIGSLMQLNARPEEVLGVAIHVVSWFAFGWNAVAAFPHTCGAVRTPQVSFVAGGRETVILAGGGQGDGKKQKGGSGCPAVLVDVALAGALLATELLLFLLHFHVSYWWGFKRNCYGIIGLHTAVMVLMFIIALLGLFSRRSTAHFVVRPAAYGSRIQLP